MTEGSGATASQARPADSSSNRNDSNSNSNGNSKSRQSPSPAPSAPPPWVDYESGVEFCVHMPHPEGVGPVRWMIFFPRRDACDDAPFPICMLLHARGALMQTPAILYRQCPSRLRQRYIIIVPRCPKEELPLTDRAPGVISPLMYCEDSRGGYHDEKLLFNESVLLRIFEESILRLSLDPRVGPSVLDLQRLQIMGYSSGSASAFNFGCLYGRFLSLIVGFGCPGEKNTYRCQSALANLRETWVLGYQVEGDKDIHKLTEMFDFFSEATSHNPAKHRRREWDGKFNFHPVGAKDYKVREERHFKTTTYGATSCKVLYTIDPPEQA